MPRNPEEQDQFHDLDYIEMIYPDVYHHPDIKTMTEEEIYEEMDKRYYDSIFTNYTHLGWDRPLNPHTAAETELLHVASILYAHHHKEG